MDARIFLDEFRPFRRGEIALARRIAQDARFLPERELALLRHALRLAQLSSLDGGAPDELVDRIAANPSFGFLDKTCVSGDEIRKLLAAQGASGAGTP